jgi:hypothetical protein
MIPIWLVCLLVCTWRIKTYEHTYLRSPQLKKTTPSLLANYRGIGRHAGMSAYEFLMPQSQN